jgi:hypothetical protein
VHERGEVGVAGSDHERGDVVAFECQLDGVDRHLDVGGVLADRPHPLGDLDQLDVVAGEHAPVLVEHRPVGVGLADHHPAPFGQGVGDRLEIEGVPSGFSGSDRQVLVVQEQGDAFVIGCGHIPRLHRSRPRAGGHACN